jgi:serine/threonine-protein kinase
MAEDRPSRKGAQRRSLIGKRPVLRPDARLPATTFPEEAEGPEPEFAVAAEDSSMARPDSQGLVSLEAEQQIGVWVVEKQLGKGGMGSVYRCRNRHASRIHAAIKLLDPVLSYQGTARARFVREAEILFTLNHPHIVKVSSVNLDSMPPYLEMEFVEGTSLEEELERRGALSLSQALGLTAQLTSAVHHLHLNGVYHRDIKPTNLLIRPDGLLKLVDFGLAVEATGDRITDAGTTFGTPSYAPPEWVQPGEIDRAAWDIYGIGVVLYEMLTGEVAFPVPQGLEARRVAIHIMTEKQQIECLDPGEAYKADLRALVRCLTQRDPKKRPRSALAVLALLESLDPRCNPEATTLIREDLDIDALWRAVADSDVPPIGVRSAGPDDETQIAPQAPPEVDPEDATQIAPQAPPEVDPDDDTVITRPAVPSPDPATARQEVRRGSPSFALLALFGIALGVAITATIAIRQYWTTTGPREVRVVVTGVSEDEAIAVRLNGSAPATQDGFTFTFAEVPVGEAMLEWAVGSGCAAPDCPGPGCQAWCATAESVATIPKGSGPFTLPVELAFPAQREVVLELPDLSESLPVTVQLDGRPLEVEGAEARAREVRPGPHIVVAEAGSCSLADRGCATRPEGCPPGCSSWTGGVEVSLGAEAFTFALPLPIPTAPPEPEPEAAPVPAPRPPDPLPAPSPGAVTKASFAAWLERHPEWSRQAAIDAGKADQSYQSGWVDGQPPGNAADAVVNVSWWAAEAYCQDRGGLLPVDVAPDTWTESSTQPLQEWRTDGGSPSWRRFDGADSQVGRWEQSNSFTGFRCAR